MLMLLSSTRRTFNGSGKVSLLDCSIGTVAGDGDLSDWDDDGEIGRNADAVTLRNISGFCGGSRSPLSGCCIGFIVGAGLLEANAATIDRSNLRGPILQLCISKTDREDDTEEFQR